MRGDEIAGPDQAGRPSFDLVDLRVAPFHDGEDRPANLFLARLLELIERARATVIFGSDTEVLELQGS